MKVASSDQVRKFCKGTKKRLILTNIYNQQRANLDGIYKTGRGDGTK